MEYLETPQITFGLTFREEKEKIKWRKRMTDENKTEVKHPW